MYFPQAGILTVLRVFGMQSAVRNQLVYGKQACFSKHSAKKSYFHVRFSLVCTVYCASLDAESNATVVDTIVILQTTTAQSTEEGRKLPTT